MNENTITNPNIAFNYTSNFVLKDIHDKKNEDFLIKGYASTFGNLDRADHIILKGAFSKSLRKNKGKWPIKLNHYDDVGMNEKAKEDDIGLYVESRLYTSENPIPESIKAMNIIKNAVRYKMAMGLSIGGRIKKMKIKFAKESDNQAKKEAKLWFEIEEFEMIEHSITSVPANPKAEITSLKTWYCNKFNNLSQKNIKKDDILFDFIENYIKNKM